MEHESVEQRSGSKEVEATVAQTWVHLTAAGFEDAGIIQSFPLADDSNPHLSYDQVLAAATPFVTREDGAVVMSLTKVLTLRIGRIGSRSIPSTIEFAGIVFAATWHQPPGAAQRSMHTLALERKSCFLLIWISLNAARDRYPCSFARV